MGTQKTTILIVEDDHDLRSILVKHIKRSGYHVIEASDGMEALKRLDHDRYDLVITDIVIPYISGVGVVTALKKKWPAIPVIAITGFGKEPELAAMEKNADLVLPKPVKMAHLLEQIARLLGTQRGGK
jgi:DNA-binding response OmpR family regulator